MPMDKTHLESSMYSTEISLDVLRAGSLDECRETGKSLDLRGQGVEKGRREDVHPCVHVGE